jgi:uncharacterized protein (DUF1778 family)
MKDKRINIKLTEQEKELWDQQAKQHNMSMSDYIRFLVMKDMKDSNK